MRIENTGLRLFAREAPWRAAFLFGTSFAGIWYLILDPIRSFANIPKSHDPLAVASGAISFAIVMVALLRSRPSASRPPA